MLTSLSKKKLTLSVSLPKQLCRFTVISLLVLLTGCSKFYKAQNSTIEIYQKGPAYRLKYFNKVHPFGENIIILAFSGGGTRAAALSYGVLKELRDTTFIDNNGSEMSLLDEVDFISSVSGGSFTAAYYGVFGDKIFTDFEKDFLKKSIEGSLISKMLSPVYWVKSLWTGFDRTELAIEYYDNHIFKRKKFEDIPFNKRPFVAINATDLSLGTRFVFDQDTFDILCADLSSYPVARAVTASSAVPMIFPTVVLKNQSGACDLSDSDIISRLKLIDRNTLRKSEYFSNIKEYQNSESRQYIHLVDGGLSDNLGLRMVSDHLEIFGIKIDENARHKIKRMILILVNSTVKPSRMMDSTPSTPSITETIDAFTSTLIENRNIDTRSYFFDRPSQFEHVLNTANPHIEVYSTEVSFESIKEHSFRNYFNQLPTSLELEPKQVDALIEAGRQILRGNPDFIRLKKAIHAKDVNSPNSSHTEKSLFHIFK